MPDNLASVIQELRRLLALTSDPSVLPYARYRDMDRFKAALLEHADALLDAATRSLEGGEASEPITEDWLREIGFKLKLPLRVIERLDDERGIRVADIAEQDGAVAWGLMPDVARNLVALANSAAENAKELAAIKRVADEYLEFDAVYDQECVLPSLAGRVYGDYAELLSRVDALKSQVKLRDKNAAENAAECERLRGLVRELRAERRPKEYVGNPRWAEERADYDAMTEAMLTPLSSLETARQAGGGE